MGVEGHYPCASAGGQAPPGADALRRGRRLLPVGITIVIVRSGARMGIFEPRMSSWSCPHQVDEICRKVSGACCRPGMRGCVLFGKVTFQDGQAPYPVWPPGADRRERARAEAAIDDGEAPPGR